MSQETHLYSNDELETRIKFLDELIRAKSSQLEMMNENLKKFEGFSIGSKEVSSKVEEFIKKQKNEMKELSAQGKLSEEVRNFTDSVIHTAQVFAKSIADENEKIYFVKQGEAVFLSQEIERLNALKINHEVALEKTKKQEETQVNKPEILKEESIQEEKQEPIVKEQKKRVRKDKNPHTKLGRTSLRLIEARKKALESSQEPSENASKKRGRKPKVN